MLQAFNFLSEKPSENLEENNDNSSKIQKTEKQENKRDEIQEKYPEIIQTQDIGKPVNYEDYFQNNRVSDQKNQEKFIEQKPKPDIFPLAENPKK